MTHEQIEVIRKRAEQATAGPWYTASTTDGPWIIEESGNIISGTCAQVSDGGFIANAREDIPALLAEVERLRREISFIAHVDLLKNAYNAEHIVVSVQSWALNVLDGINHDGK